ncbi:MAG: type II toxin-antitoxin system RelE/ParE family toxin [Magnetococcales bacterium]|nr:type II toxin-antitoxin system RelE/ParE family toxin [Magnetococcales bacterium]NGZ25764.1 type II toxin-antitoxin system RelE/ParE family toxin [Magnetococcales bacterium]
MNKIIQSDKFYQWISQLKDKIALARIRARIDRLALGHRGDVKPLRDGIWELRIDCGPGYRVYYAQQGSSLVILLAGGDKKTQESDIEIAVQLAKKWRESLHG